MLATDSSDGTWVIDSGASHHMCNNRDLFLPHTLTKTNFSIKLGDQTTVGAVEKGMIPINAAHIEALFVPRFRISLLSVSKLDSQLGWYTSFGGGKCKIIDNTGTKVLQASCSRGLYQTKLSQFAMSNYGGATHGKSKTRSPASLITWHKRLAHLHDAAVKLALPANIKLSDPTERERSCDTCIKAKMKQKFNRQPVERSTIPFELIHSDLCGPMRTSNGGANYYIIYIDDCTRYVEVFLLVTKTAQEIVGKFQAFKAWVETQGYRIRRFRCDNGTGEYTNSTFLDLLTKNGISFEPSPPYTQHKNGVSERMIQTLNTKARCLLLDSGIPSRFWAEAIKTAAYIHRRTPTNSLPAHQSPFEALYGTKPPLHHLKRFGCIVYRHIPKEQRSGKFAERARPCMFLGYVHKTTKIYRIWDFNGRGRALESSNVHFVEDEDAWSAVNGQATDTEDLESIFPGENLDEDTEAQDNSRDELPGRRERNVPPEGEGQPLGGESRDIPPWGPQRPPASEELPKGMIQSTYQDAGMTATTSWGSPLLASPR